MREFTLIVPYYRQPVMLRRQVVEWERYPEGVNVIVVDDGSPEPAEDIIPEDSRAALYRIETDIPWNRNGARNLGAHVAETDWILQTDIDHVLLSQSAARLRGFEFQPDPEKWYRLARYRVGRADDTRKKDVIPEDADFGEIKPHIDSYLITRDLYWSVGGYDEDYSGSLGGSAPFLALLGKERCEVLKHIALHVHTRDVIADASEIHLSRSQARFKALRKEKGDAPGKDPLRFPWHRVR